MEGVKRVDKTDEGRLIDNMYDIPDYLICKQNGKPWSKTESASTFRGDIKRMFGDVGKSFQKHGYQIYDGGSDNNILDKGDTENAS